VRPARITLAVLALAAACMPPSWGAGALLHPTRRHVSTSPALPHWDVAFESQGVQLRGWLFPTGSSRGTTVVVLHGIADNRESAVWIAERLTPRGFDVLAYDSRAHGESGGEACTYGYFEKRDLSRAFDALGVHRAILIGNSLGAAIALQTAADDPRIVAVVAADTFSDLESIARERAPFFAADAQIREAFALAEQEAHFRVQDVSPIMAARRVGVPVLLLQSAEDNETPRTHSEKVFAALAGPRKLLIVPGARHGEALGKAWNEVQTWIMGLAPAASPSTAQGTASGYVPAPR
jgi:uncharacterized protein